MHTQRTVGAAALLLSALAVGACSDATPTRTAATSELPPASPSSPAPSSPAPSTTDRSPDPRNLGDTSGALSAGRWAVKAGGSRDVPRAVLDLPDGLYGGGQYVWSQGESPRDGGWILGYWTGGPIYLDPCTSKAGFDADHHFPDVWSEALGAQRRTLSTEPVRVRLDGHRGLYLELTPRKGLDLDKCRDGRLSIFDTTAPGGPHVIVESGVVDRLWMVDVDGDPIVLTVQVTPRTTAAQLQQITEIVESLRFGQEA